MWRRDAQPLVVGQRPGRCRAEQRLLLVESLHHPPGSRGNLIATEHPDELIDARQGLKQLILVAFGQAAGDDDAAQLPSLLQGEHLANHGVRLAPGIADETARIDDDEIGPLRFSYKLIPLLAKQTGHSFAIDEVLWAAEADEGIGSSGAIFGHVEQWGVGDKPVRRLVRAVKGRN
jgi:hypothetical protein